MPEENQQYEDQITPKNSAFAPEDGKKQVLGEIQTVFEKDGEEPLTDEEQGELLINPPKKPGFPYFIMTAAVLKDVLDSLDISGVGIIFTTLLSLVLSLIMLIWIFGKMSGGFVKKRLIRWIWVRFFAVILIEFIPGIKIIPTNTIFILMAHNKEKKIVQLFNSALEKLKKAGF